MQLPVNRCRLCGATSYRRVVARNDAGALVATSLYQCTGCSVVFTDPKAWREGGMPDTEGLPPPPEVPRMRSPEPGITPTAPDWSGYMPGLPGSRQS